MKCNMKHKKDVEYEKYRTRTRPDELFANITPKQPDRADLFGAKAYMEAFRSECAEPYRKRILWEC